MNIPVISALALGMAAASYWKKLTIPAALTGGVVGWLSYVCAGYTGLGMLAAFFVLGTGATSWKKEQKEGHQTTRTTGQVLANGGVAALMGLGCLFFQKEQSLFQMMMAGSLAAATADTLSSELGTVYGRKFYNILTGRPDIKGRDGVVSLEGWGIGLLGSTVIALIYVIGLRPASPVPQCGIVILSGTIGNAVDSVLGASLERRGRLSNDAVNLLNTLSAGVVAGILFFS